MRGEQERADRHAMIVIIEPILGRFEVQKGGSIILSVELAWAPMGAFGAFIEEHLARLQLHLQGAGEAEACCWHAGGVAEEALRCTPPRSTISIGQPPWDPV